MNKPLQHRCFVYGIWFHRAGHQYSGKIRYIGKSLYPDRRLRRHLSLNEAHGRLHRSIRKHGRECFSMEILCVSIGATQREAELEALRVEVLLIAEHNTAYGDHGLNLTIGGEGVAAVGEARQNHSMASRRVMREIKQRPEVRAKYRELGRKKMQDPKFREAIFAPDVLAQRSRTMRAKHDDPAYHARQVAIQKARSTPAFKNMSREKLIAHNKDPEFQKRRVETFRRNHPKEVFGPKISAIAKAQHQDPDFAKKYRDGLRAKHADPEYAAAHAAHTKARHSNPAFGRSAKIGIAIYWAKHHLGRGNARSAGRQIDTLRGLLSECVAHGEQGDAVDKANTFLLELARTSG